MRRQVFLGYKAQTKLRELREKVKKLEKVIEVKISSVQFEGAGEESKPEEFRKMEVDEEVDSKKKVR